MPFAGIENPMAIRVIDDVVEIRDTLFLHEIAQNIHVAIRFGIGGENVVVGNDDDFVCGPRLWRLCRTRV